MLKKSTFFAVFILLAFSVLTVTACSSTLTAKGVVNSNGEYQSDGEKTDLTAVVNWQDDVPIAPLALKNQNTTGNFDVEENLIPADNTLATGQFDSTNMANMKPPSLITNSGQITKMTTGEANYPNPLVSEVTIAKKNTGAPPFTSLEGNTGTMTTNDAPCRGAPMDNKSSSYATVTGQMMNDANTTNRTFLS